jgi:ribosome-associated toxin RatA of RatAB toxin-antitoxin module
MDSLKIESNHPIGNPFKQIKNNWKIIQHQSAPKINTFLKDWSSVSISDSATV